MKRTLTQTSTDNKVSKYIITYFEVFGPLNIRFVVPYAVALSPGVTMLEPEVRCSLSTNTKTENMWSFTFKIPMHLHVMPLKYRNYAKQQNI
jgi:hypothetical protein